MREMSSLKVMMQGVDKPKSLIMREGCEKTFGKMIWGTTFSWHCQSGRNSFWTHGNSIEKALKGNSLSQDKKEKTALPISTKLALMIGAPSI